MTILLEWIPLLLQPICRNHSLEAKVDKIVVLMEKMDTTFTLVTTNQSLDMEQTRALTNHMSKLMERIAILLDRSR